MNLFNNDTIAAISTAPGMGAIAVIRLSGDKSFQIATNIFSRKGKFIKAEDIESHKAYYGDIKDPASNDGSILDEVVVTFFKAPHSYTGEDVVEISCHGSLYIQQAMLELMVRQGARLAEAGEFTMRGFSNKKFDLAQAEAVADLISSQSKSAHRIAMNQMRGGFSSELQTLRTKLLDITSLVELELDFSEEDVEFADRTQLRALLDETLNHTRRLSDSFRYGNVIKNGVPVAIVGEPNVGKSTLLNAILKEDRAIVSDIPGTTRDTIEETVNLNGTLFRFIDTAGIRESEEEIEKIGIERTFKKLSKAEIVIGVVDRTKNTDDIVSDIKRILDNVNLVKQRMIIVLNKEDLLGFMSWNFEEMLFGYIVESIRKNIDSHNAYMTDAYEYCFDGNTLCDIRDRVFIRCMSAKSQRAVESLCSTITMLRPRYNEDSILVTNVRHYEALLKATEELEAVIYGLDSSLPIDLVAQNLRQAIFHLGTITGEITTDDILGNIFGKFCIGK